MRRSVKLDASKHFLFPFRPTLKKGEEAYQYSSLRAIVLLVPGA